MICHRMWDIMSQQLFISRVRTRCVGLRIFSRRRVQQYMHETPQDFTVRLGILLTKAEFAARSGFILNFSTLWFPLLFGLHTIVIWASKISHLFTNAMAKCYYSQNSTVIFLNGDQKLCGPSISEAQVCCFSSDTCLEDSICHYTHPLVGGSGYYVGGCTDPNFPEPCSRSCSK